jgi:Fe-S cluster biogenesis protein NfuA
MCWPINATCPTINKTKRWLSSQDTAMTQSPSDATPPGNAPLRERVEEILSLIRPVIQSDGGDVELVDVTDDGFVTVRFLGACVGCPSSNMTLQSGIERQLKDRIPEVQAVHAVA